MILRQGIVTAAVTAGLGWSWDLRNNLTTGQEREREMKVRGQGGRKRTKKREQWSKGREREATKGSMPKRRQVNKLK